MDIKILKSASSTEVFSVDFNMSLVHQVLVAEQNRLRVGTKAQKNRSAVKGGGAKPWKQKGTGRARAGTSRSPIWRKGGVTFAAQPRNYSVKINRKMWQGAMRSLISEMLRDGTMVICESFSLAEPKTKELNKQLNSVDLKDVMVVTEDFDEKLHLASRNLYHVAVAEVSELSILTLLQYKSVLVTKTAMVLLQQRFGK